MFLDKQNQLSDSQALTATAVSSNTFDSGSAGNDISIGDGLALAVNVEVAADFTTTDETYELQIIQSANADLSSPDVLASRVIAASLLKAGSNHYLGLPPGSKTKRYLGARYVLGGTSPSMTVSSFIQPDSMLQNNKAYANNYSIK
jgi:hypothetical protein